MGTPPDGKVSAWVDHNAFPVGGAGSYTDAVSEHGGAAESTRDKILSAAIALTEADGWAALTMGGVAGRAGVSRQTVYNEFGNRDQLGEAMVLTELAGFMGAVGTAFDEHPDDLVAAIRAAAFGVLDAARNQPVLQAVVSASQGAETELLPLLTTQAGEIMVIAKTGIRERTAAYALDMDQRSRDAALDTVVRLVFSHLMRPGGDPADAADDIAWVASRMLTLA